MNTLARIYGKQKIKGDDLLLAELLPLMHMELFLNGKSTNAEIDVLFECSYRAQIIGQMTKTKAISEKGLAAHKALVGACDNAADKGKMALDPSTDQKKAVCAVLKMLARIAPSLTNEVYTMSRLGAAECVTKTIGSHAQYQAMQAEKKAA